MSIENARLLDAVFCASRQREESGKVTQALHLLLLVGEAGLYCFDRRSRKQHLLSWEEAERVWQAVKGGILVEKQGI